LKNPVLKLDYSANPLYAVFQRDFRGAYMKRPAWPKKNLQAALGNHRRVYRQNYRLWFTILIPFPIVPVPALRNTLPFRFKGHRRVAA
jgi:hypothetical protein